MTSTLSGMLMPVLHKLTLVPSSNAPPSLSSLAGAVVKRLFTRHFNLGLASIGSAVSSNLSERYGCGSRRGQAFVRLLHRVCHKHGRTLVGVPLLATSITKPVLAENSHKGPTKRMLLMNHEISDPDLPDQLLLNHVHDIEKARELIDKTLMCPGCSKRLMVTTEVDGIEYCQCSVSAGKKQYGVQTEDIPWQPFLEKPGIIVWRQEHPEVPGMYIYKMYGHMGDISACEYFQVQMDLSTFRLTWDKNAVQVRVINEALEEKKNSLSQMYYWEVAWPRFFSNRDYVCNRRSQIFSDYNVGVMYSKTSQHASAPVNDKNIRVEEYWSVLTLEPSTTWNKEGLEFCLTVFENQGVSLPSSVTTWVAMRGMPEFMEHLRSAVFTLREWMAERNIIRDEASNKGNLVSMVSMPMPHDDTEGEGMQDYYQPPLQRQFQDPSEIAGEKVKVAKPAETRATAAPPPQRQPQQQPYSSESRKYVYVNISL